MNFAIIPPDRSWYEDDINVQWPFIEQTRKLMCPLGHRIDIINKVEDLYNVDYFIFINLYEWSWPWLKKIIKYKLENRLIYLMDEPAVVLPWHTERGTIFLLKYFKYICTWNLTLVDQVRIIELNIPYLLDYRLEVEKVEFQSRRLLVNISGDKSSKHPDELYSERRKIIEYFENSNADEFTLYGVGWINRGYKNYEGMCKSKFEVYQHFRFAVCLENMLNGNNYITEKILECFLSGIVPIYLGASNITDKVPKESFISYNQFESIPKMLEFIRHMEEEEYNKYLVAAQKFLNSEDSNVFRVSAFCDKLCNLGIKDKNGSFQFKINRIDKLVLYVRVGCTKRLRVLRKELGKIYRFLMNKENSF